MRRLPPVRTHRCWLVRERFGFPTARTPAPRRPRARAGTWLPPAARASWRALVVLEHVARGGGIRALGVGELVVDGGVDRRVAVRGVRRLHGRVLGRRPRLARSHAMVTRSRWVGSGHGRGGG